MRRHRHQEFIRFLNAVERAVPAEESHPRHRRQLRNGSNIVRDRRSISYRHRLPGPMRVSMNITTAATSLASSRLPDSLASFSFSGGQSASNALMTGPGEIEPTRMPCLKTWRRTVWTKQLIAHLDDA
jgi:hypothetical protein